MAKQLHLRILGTGRYLPKKVVPNSFFAGKTVNYYNRDGTINTSKEPVVLKENKIFATTGILERRKASKTETVAYMGAKAADEALYRSKISKNDLAGLIVASITHEKETPSAASLIQKELGLKGCFAKDISAACSGFVSGLIEANARVRTRPGNYLVIASEKLSRLTDYNDINSTLFGDGAGAAVLGPTNEKYGILGEYEVCTPEDENTQLIITDPRNKLRMPYGDRVLKAAVPSMVNSVEYLMNKMNWDVIDGLIVHQANERIIDNCESRLNGKARHIPRLIRYLGNTSASTVAITLDEVVSTDIFAIGSGKKLILSSFGAGFVTAAVPVII